MCFDSFSDPGVGLLCYLAYKSFCFSIFSRAPSFEALYKYSTCLYCVVAFFWRSDGCFDAVSSRMWVLGQPDVESIRENQRNFKSKTLKESKPMYGVISFALNGFLYTSTTNFANM